MAIKEDVLKFFSTKGSIPGNSEKEKLLCEYLEVRLLDSMGIVDMVTKFETDYGIRFSADDLQSERFRSIGGVIEIIENLQAVS